MFHVYPHGFEGTKIEPSFEGLMCAYNHSCSGGDFATAGRPRVLAGDTLLVHAGLCRYDRYEYGGGNRTVPFEGTHYLTADGTPERPIAIKAAGDGEVIFDGNGNFALFNVMAADYTYFEGITFRNTEFAIWAGEQFIAGAKGLTVKRSRFEDVGVGVFTNYSGSSNFYIADNRFHGRNDPERLIGWSDAPLWGRFDGVDGQVHPPVMASYVAVKLYGPEEYSAATGQDRNSVEVGYDVFVNVPALDARDVSTLQTVYDADDLDFRLRTGSAAVDRGIALPTVTDGFTGSAPDLGALEVGVAAPHYGPRP